MKWGCLFCIAVQQSAGDGRKGKSMDEDLEDSGSTRGTDKARQDQGNTTEDCTEGST